MEYSVVKYGFEWAIFSKTANCYVLFSWNKKEIEQRCKELNEQDRMDKQNCKP